MKQILFLLISLLFIGCGDGEDQVASSSTESSANLIVPLEVGETRTFALNMRVDQSYLVTAQTEGTDKKVEYRVDYLNRTYPEVVVTGVNDGVEDFTVTAEDASGYKQSALIRATVYQGTTDVNGTAVDIADTEGGGTGTDPNGGGGDNGGGTTPPVINPISDPNACLDNDPTWATVGDSWGTTEGRFSDDNHYWVRSQIPEEPSSVLIYYKRYSVSQVFGYTALGRYKYVPTAGQTIQFDLQILTELLGKEPYFYVKHGTSCFRGSIPSSPLMPADTTLVPVFSGSLF